MMEKGNDGLRDRLLARLPQPENLAAYREETASLLAKQEKALFSDRFVAVSLLLLGFALWLTVNSTWAKVDTNAKVVLESFAGLFYFMGAIGDLRYRINRSKVDLMK